MPLSCDRVRLGSNRVNRYGDELAAAIARLAGLVEEPV